MERVKKIYHTLSKSEQRYLRTYLEAFHSKGENKALLLLDAIEKNPEITQSEVAEALYGDTASKAFIMMKARLLERMLDVMTLGFSLQNNPDFRDDQPTLDTLEAHKKYIHATMLRKRGLDDLATELLKKMLKEAEELSLPELKLLALVNLRNMSSDPQEVEQELSPQIQQAFEAYEKDIAGATYFDVHRVKYANRSADDAVEIQFLEKAVKDLCQRNETASSPRSLYYMLNLEVVWHQLTHHFEASRDALDRLIALITSSKALNVKSRKSIPFLRKASVELRVQNFEEAYQAAVQAKAIIDPRRLNYLSASIAMMYAAIYTNRLGELRNLLKSINQQLSEKQRNQSGDIIHYLEACAWFMENKLFEAMRSMMTADKLLSDKKGWNVGMRIFEIMLLIDMAKLDLATARIETLRKHISRHESNPREDLIYRFLNSLERQAYDFRKLTPEMEHILQALSCEVAWLSLGHEVVRFDTWVRSKINKEPFYPLFIKELQQNKQKHDR